MPFCLWHKTRATQELIILIQSMLATGCSINSVTTMLLQRRYSAYAKKINVVKKVSVQFPSFEEWSGHSPSIAPTRYFVSACFLLKFWEREGQYCRYMQELSINESSPWISCDHTFSSAGELKTHLATTTLFTGR